MTHAKCVDKEKLQSGYRLLALSKYFLLGPSACKDLTLNVRGKTSYRLNQVTKDAVRIIVYHFI